MVAKEWLNEVLLGNEIIDGQHERIMHLVSEMEELQHGHSGAKKRFYLLLSSLMLEITTHFRDEESVLAENGCPWLDEQIRDHAYFVGRLSAILSMEESDVPEQVVQFMTQWLETHLRKLDKKCQPYISDR